PFIISQFCGSLWALSSRSRLTVILYSAAKADAVNVVAAAVASVARREPIPTYRMMWSPREVVLPRGASLYLLRRAGNPPRRRETSRRSEFDANRVPCLTYSSVLPNARYRRGAC